MVVKIYDNYQPRAVKQWLIMYLVMCVCVDLFLVRNVMRYIAGCLTLLET